MSTSGYNNPHELWSSDGTVKGTKKLATLNSIERQYSNYDQSWPASEDYVYFIGSNDEIGKEVWRTDGTAKGTVPLADIQKGPTSSYPRGLTMVGNTAYFYAKDQDISLTNRDPYSLWRSDGNGVTKVATMPNSFQGEMGVAGNTLLFAADDISVGRELFGIDIAASQAATEGVVSLKLTGKIISEDNRLLPNSKDRKIMRVNITRKGGDSNKELRVNLELGGAAKLWTSGNDTGADYQLLNKTRSQLVTSNQSAVFFAPGEKKVTLEVVPLTDSESETTEQISFKLTGVQGDSSGYKISTKNSQAEGFILDASRYGIASATGFNHVSAGRELPFRISKSNNLNKTTELYYLVTPFLDPSRPELKFSTPAQPSDFKRSSASWLSESSGDSYYDLAQWQKLTFKKGETSKGIDIRTVLPKEPSQSKSARLWIYNASLENRETDWLKNPAYQHVDFLVHSKPTLVFGDPTYNVEGEQSVMKIGRFGGGSAETTVRVATEQYDTVTGLELKSKQSRAIAKAGRDFTPVSSTRSFSRDTDDPNNPGLFYFSSNLPKTNSQDSARVFTWTARQLNRNGKEGNILTSQLGTIFEPASQTALRQTQLAARPFKGAGGVSALSTAFQLSSVNSNAGTAFLGGITTTWNNFVSTLSNAISGVASAFYGESITTNDHKQSVGRLSKNSSRVIPVPAITANDSLQVTGSGGFLVPTTNGAGAVGVNGDSLSRMMNASLFDPDTVRLIDVDGASLRAQLYLLSTLSSDELQQVIDRYDLIGLDGASLKKEIKELAGIKNDSALSKAILKSSVINLNGAALIGLDGASLIGLDGASFSSGTTLNLIGLDGASLRVKLNTIENLSLGSAEALSKLIGLDGASLIGLDGASLKAETARLGSIKDDTRLRRSLESSKLIGLDGASLIGLDGASLIGLDGASFRLLTANSLIGLDGASLVGLDGASLTRLSGASFIDSISSISSQSELAMMNAIAPPEGLTAF